MKKEDFPGRQGTPPEKIWIMRRAGSSRSRMEELTGQKKKGRTDHRKTD